MDKQKIIEKNVPSQEEFNDLIANVNNLEHHSKLIKKSIRFLKNIPSISSIFILGSLSSKTGDVFSDIDLYLMVKDEDEDEISHIRHELISNYEKLGELIHFVYSMAN
ncbi:MAG: hypothetical protein GF383_02095, partial [Candidatus Lokiarchaeota archaeon]|nr:hypothetical protein [Candidatus Lokiarchaeota archaeon]